MVLDLFLLVQTRLGSMSDLEDGDRSPKQICLGVIFLFSPAQ